MDQAFIVEKTKDYVQRSLSGEASGHDWWHIYRVWRLALKIAHEEHYSALEKVHEELKKAGIEFESLGRVEVDGLIENVDLVISVGGDGTFLDASHFLEDVPL